MMQKDAQFFHEIATDDIKNFVVILDIDGTITCSSHNVITEPVHAKIRQLQENNVVYLFSNNFNNERSRAIARQLNIPYIKAPHKKPNWKIFEYIDPGSCPVVAIGDKYLTDELFAIFGRCDFIRVKRYRRKEDSFFDKLSCLFDDCVYFFAKLLHIVK
jgi:predicted HAD superfamily phosphohydrolase YqeG